MTITAVGDSHGNSNTVTVSAVCFQNEASQVLTVRKAGTEYFMFPGGKLEPGETAAQAAAREVLEEIGIDLLPAALTEVGNFTAPAANEPDTTVHATVYRAHLRGEPAAAGEIAELRWFDRTSTSPELAPLLRDHVLPLLTDQARPER